MSGARRSLALDSTCISFERRRSTPVKPAAWRRFQVEQAHELRRRLRIAPVIAGVLLAIIWPSIRSGARCSAVMLELGRFKQLNDERGHGAGDHALR